jgi:hypothetical protein
MRSALVGSSVLAVVLAACADRHSESTAALTQPLGTTTAGTVDVMSCPGVTGDGDTDDWAAIQACINTNPSARILFPKRRAPEISVFPKGDYRLGRTLYLCGGEQALDGVTGGSGYGTTLRYANGTTGIDVAANATDPCAEVSGGIGGVTSCPCYSKTEPPQATQIANFNLVSDPPPNRCSDNPHDACFLSAAGIRVRSSATVVSNVAVTHFGGHGVTIEGPPGIIADHVKLTNITSSGNRGSGFFVDGYDAQVAVISGCDARGNEMWGFDEDGFLGNTYVHPHTTSNRLGPFRAVNGAATNVFINPFAEMDQPASQINYRNIVVGGNMGPGYDWSLHPNVLDTDISGLRSSGTMFTNRNASGATTPIQFGAGGHNHDVNGAFYVNNAAAPGQSFLSFRRTTTGADGWWGFGVYGHDASSPAYRDPAFYGLLMPDAYTADAALRPWFPQGLYIGYPGVTTSRRKIVVDSSPPTAGVWENGDIVLNTSTNSSSRSVGWVNVDGGSPGEWRAFGPIGETTASAVSTTGTLSAWMPGALDGVSTAMTWTPDRPVTITRVQAQLRNAPLGCAGTARIRVTNGGSFVELPLTAAANDTGVQSQPFAAGLPLTVALHQPAAGCAQMPTDANVVVQYRMQQ